MADGLSQRDEEGEVVLLTMTLITMSHVELCDEIKQHYQCDPKVKALFQQWKNKELRPNLM